MAPNKHGATAQPRDRATARLRCRHLTHHAYARERARTSFLASSSGPFLRATSVTFAPSDAHWIATALPMPCGGGLVADVGGQG